MATIRAYAAKNRAESVRAASSSGGVFLALCQSVVNSGGVVYGVRFGDDLMVIHARATSMTDCRRFSGSKYVQSLIGQTFRQVREDLVCGRSVLFSGTPCQVAGLQSYLESQQVSGDLLLVDLVCHGVPSPRVWADHVRLTEARLGEPLVDYRFRDKGRGWHEPRNVAIADRHESADGGVFAFQELFNSNLILRPSCCECPWASLDRPGDITLGDYWGVERHYPELDDNRGVSLVLTCTSLGEAAIGATRGHVEYVDIGISECLQGPLQRPTPASPQRSAFWRIYSRLGYERAIKRFTSYGLARRLVRSVRRSLKRRQR